MVFPTEIKTEFYIKDDSYKLFKLFLVSRIMCDQFHMNPLKVNEFTVIIYLNTKFSPKYIIYWTLRKYVQTRNRLRTFIVSERPKLWFRTAFIINLNVLKSPECTLFQLTPHLKYLKSLHWSKLSSEGYLSRSAILRRTSCSRLITSTIFKKFIKNLNVSSSQMQRLAYCPCRGMGTCFGNFVSSRSYLLPDGVVGKTDSYGPLVSEVLMTES